MKKQTHSLHTRLLSMLLALVCVLGLLPTAALAASPDTIKLEDCAYNGVHYNSPALGECWLHQMQFSYNGDSVMGFCSQKGAGMGRSLEGHTWDSPTPINDPTVKTMMAYFYCHSKGIFTDQAVALGSDEVWGSEYTWTMNAWVQAVVWRYKAGLLSDPAAACAEELLYVYNNLYHTSYSSIDEEMDGISFRDRAQYILDLGAQGVWGDCAVYEYTYAGPGTSYHPANDVQSVVVGELTITREQYELTIRKVDDELIDTVTTDKNGRVFTALEDGAYYAVEIEAAEGFKLDDTPHYFEVEDGKTTTLRIENDAFSGILIKKIDSSTREGIYGVTFLLYDSNKNPIGQYTSDDRGYVYIDDLPSSGRYYLRELEAADGYLLDEQLKTVYVTAGTTTEVIWENTAVTGQIQVTKTSADYNSMNGWPAGTPIPNTEFEIYNARTGKLVDTIKTDKNGVAVSRPLPLARYKIVESKAADFYGLDQTPIEVEIEYAGQIVRAAMTNKSLYTNVSIKKTGYTEVMPGQQIRYDFSGIANNSTTSLTSFFWRGTLPTQAVRLDKIVTGTYNVPGNYKVVYKTNLNPNYRTMYDNLSTQQNYVLDASPAALGLASNEVITEFMVVFGVVPANFRQVEAPQVYCNVVSWLTGGTQFVNQADVGGIYNGQWIMAASRWVTKVYKPAQPLPRTGY